MPTLYGIPNCDTVRRARAWLEGRGVEAPFHDFRKQGLPAARLDAWLAAAGWERVVNRQGTTWKKLDDAARAAVVDAASARALLLTDSSEEIGPAQILFDQAARLANAPAAPQDEPRRLAAVVQRSEAEAIMEVLASVGGNRLAAARELGISERTLRYRLASFREAGLAVAGAGR